MILANFAVTRHQTWTTANETSRAFTDIPLERPGYYFGIFAGHSVIFLGSNEKRDGEGITIGYGENFPGLRFQRYPGEFVLELSGDISHGGGFDIYQPNQRVGVSLLPLSRWRGRPRHNASLFFDAGIGLFFRNPTADVNSFISTQPTIDLGVSWNRGSHEWLVGLRLRHSSNGGTKGPNAGENFLNCFLDYRF